MNNKTQPIRRCSCRACRSGLRTEGGSFMATLTERKLRHKGKLDARKVVLDPEYAESLTLPAVGAGFSD